MNTYLKFLIDICLCKYTRKLKSIIGSSISKGIRVYTQIPIFGFLRNIYPVIKYASQLLFISLPPICMFSDIFLYIIPSVTRSNLFFSFYNSNDFELERCSNAVLCVCGKSF